MSPMITSNRVVATAAAVILLTAGCASQNDSSGATPSASESSASPSASASVSPSEAEESFQTQASAEPSEQNADATVDDLMTAVSPDACQPSTRMSDGRIPGEVTSFVDYEPGNAWSPVYLDMAGLGHAQALAVFTCGGANAIPDHLMLTDTGGALLGSVALSDHTDTEHATVRSLTASGDTVQVTWTAAGPAGSDPVDHVGVVSYSAGQLVYTEQ